MKATAICIIVITVTLAVAGVLAVSVPLLTYTPPEPVVYEGTILGFYEENADLLNAAAEILWQHPEFFDQHRLLWEHDSQFLAREILEDTEGADHSMFTDAEWLTIRRLFEETEMTILYYYYGFPPELVFYLRTTQEGLVSLHYIRTEGYTPSQVVLELCYYGQHYARFEPLENTHWYIAYREED